MRPMATRRPAHVRPRPPSDGRPRPRVRPVRAGAPLPDRLIRHRPIRRTTGLPLPASLLLVVAILVLGGAVLLAGTGALGRTVAGFGAAFSGVIERLAPPSASAQPSEFVTGAPTLTAPANPFTNRPAIDIVGTVPLTIVGNGQYTVRLYLVQKGQAPALLREIPVGATPSFVIPAVALSPGQNDFTATIHGPGGDSDQSPVVSYILDTAPPTINISSPKSGAVVSAASVAIAGKTKAGSTISAHADPSGASGTAIAASDGTFQLTMQLIPGANAITLRATDPAGNIGSITLNVQRSTGQPLISLTAAPTRLSAAKPPAQILLTAKVTAGAGGPLAGATVTFSLLLPGIAPVTQEAQTDSTGTAVWPVPIAGATQGTGTATACVQTSTTPPVCSPGARAAIVVGP